MYIGIATIQFGSVEKLNTFVRTCADGILLLLLLLFPFESFDIIFSVCSTIMNVMNIIISIINKLYAKQIYNIKTYLNKYNVYIK